jgi:subtilisin family serine protease
VKKIGLVFLCMLFISCGSDQVTDISVRGEAENLEEGFALQSVLSRLDTEQYREGEVLVKFRSGTLSMSSSAMHQKYGASVARRYGSDPCVEYAEPNYIRRASVVPNGPLFPQQWGFHSTVFPGADIQAPEAWDISTGSRTIIAFIDTGMDYNHPDLAENVWIHTAEIPDNGLDDDGNGYIDDIRGWNFINDNNEPLDDNGHGTHTAGISGAVGNNGIGVSGLLWNVQLMPLKILDVQGIGTVADEVSAIQYALDAGSTVLNASLTGGVFSNAEFEAIKSAKDAGVLFVAAAGNGGGDVMGDNNDIIPQYPASYALPNIISVAATGLDDSRAPFSNFGSVSVHVAAPGVDITSTFPSTLVPSGYVFMTGTSQSASFVSGLAGLLYSIYPDFTYAQIRGTILRSVDILPSFQGIVASGGRINAYKALSSLLPPDNLTADTSSRSRVILSWRDNAMGEDGFQIERSISGGQYVQIGDIPADSTTFTDTGLSSGVVYSYRVRAYNTIYAYSLYSNSASVVLSVSSGGNGGGGCSVGMRQNSSSTDVDITFYLMAILSAIAITIFRRSIGCS